MKPTWTTTSVELVETIIWLVDWSELSIGVVDVGAIGRQRRFHTRAQRIAMSLRDKGCTAQDCDRPPAMTHAHHDIPWSGGGNTNLDNGRLLCGHHHRRIHDHRYQTTRHANGKVSFHRRT